MMLNHLTTLNHLLFEPRRLVFLSGETAPSTPPASPETFKSRVNNAAETRQEVAKSTTSGITGGVVTTAGSTTTTYIAKTGKLANLLNDEQ